MIQLASDLRTLADMFAPHSFRLRTRIGVGRRMHRHGKTSRNTSLAVDRPKVDLCLDTFQTAGGEWGDPTTPSGLIENAGSLEELEKLFKAGLEELFTAIPNEKIYLLQISDAYKPPSPFENKEEESGRWPLG